MDECNRGSRATPRATPGLATGHGAGRRHGAERGPRSLQRRGQGRSGRRNIHVGCLAVHDARVAAVASHPQAELAAQRIGDRHGLNLGRGRGDRGDDGLHLLLGCGESVLQKGEGCWGGGGEVGGGEGGGIG